jgi:hypothetical protein
MLRAHREETAARLDNHPTSRPSKARLNHLHDFELVALLLLPDCRASRTDPSQCVMP